MNLKVGGRKELLSSASPGNKHPVVILNHNGNNNNDEKLRATQKYLKLNCWVGVLNKHCFELYEVPEFMAAVEAAGVDVRTVGSP